MAVRQARACERPTGEMGHLMRGKVVENNAISTDLAVDTIRAGGLVVCPTTTNYVLVCDAQNPIAVRRVFQVKKRNRVAPLPIVFPRIEVIPDYARIPAWFPEEVLYKLMPGPIGLIFPQKVDFPLSLTCGLKTIAVAHTDDQSLTHISRKFDGPLAATSANLSGQGEIRISLEKAVNDIGNEVDLIIDGGPTAAEIADTALTKAATLVDCSLGRPFLCRDGVIPASVVQKYLPDLETDIDAYYEAMRRQYPSFPNLTFNHETLEIVPG
jgi:L-threonylcarbamoyladenylate synthase